MVPTTVDHALHIASKGYRWAHEQGCREAGCQRAGACTAAASAHLGVAMSCAERMPAHASVKWRAVACHAAAPLLADNQSVGHVCVRARGPGCWCPTCTRAGWAWTRRRPATCCQSWTGEVKGGRGLANAGGTGVAALPA